MPEAIICYVFASRTRPAKFFRCLENIKELSASKNYFIVAKLDEDDPYADDYRKRLNEFPEVIVKWGVSNGKIHAINRGIENLPSFDIICCHSDDMVFLVKGYDDIIRKHCGLDDYVHFPDGHVNERLSTYSIMGRDYFNRFGYIYHPDYKSVYADNEQNDVSKILGRYKYINENIVRHEHPIWGYGQPDELLKKTEDPVNYQIDCETYKRRQAFNFYT